MANANANRSPECASALIGIGPEGTYGAFGLPIEGPYRIALGTGSRFEHLAPSAWDAVIRSLP